MAPAAEKLWREIVDARPADFFMPGSLSMLRTYCELSVELEKLTARMSDETSEYDALLNRISKLAMLQATFGRQLRISVQSAMRVRTAQRNEKTEPISKRPWLPGA
jgi:hypothetical protein